MKELYNY